MATVDVSKFISEIDRMGRGEISFDLGYLEELLEYDGIDNIELSLVCSNCESEGYTLECQFCGEILDDEIESE